MVGQQYNQQTEMGNNCITYRNNKPYPQQNQVHPQQHYINNLRFDKLETLKKQISTKIDQIDDTHKIDHGFLLTLKKQISNGSINKHMLVKLSKQISNNTQSTIESLHNIYLLKQKSDFESKIKLGQFHVSRMLGKGAFGKVYLVKHENSKYYALKVIAKKEVKKHSLTENVLLEKEILMENKMKNSLFMLKMEGSFQTSIKCYLVTELVEGGDLFKLLSTKKRLKENMVKFYLAELLIALEELHNRNIIYRDLKPENILLEQNGHIKLADFGLCKKMKYNCDRTYTVCGTCEYQAPEMILNQGYNHVVDYWALGILAYELLYGMPPFIDYDRNHTNIMCQIVKNNIEFHDIGLDADTIDFIKKLTKKNMMFRLGYQNIQEIKNHPFFRDIDWAKIRDLDYQPPFSVGVKKPKENNLVKFRDLEHCKEMIKYPKILGYSFDQSASLDQFIDFDNYF